MDVTSAPVRALAEALRSGTVTARELIEASLARIADDTGEGRRAFLAVSADEARAAADGYDRMRAGGAGLPPFAGIPVAIKDLADIAGQVTTAGSVVLADQPPALADAPAVARLRAAGFVPIGRTNMTEFAYSGLGLNHHHDTPRSPWDRTTGHIPGGSSSGTAVAVADGMATAGLGTDTGGSCRIPAAFCGIVGYKPTASRVPLDGIYPLSFSLDSVGPLARSVDCCAIVDAVFAGGSGAVDDTVAPARRYRLGMLQNVVLDGIEPVVAQTYERALADLAAAGMALADVSFPELDELAHLHRGGGLAAAEAYAWHAELLAERGEDYDQRVRNRIMPGASADAAYYIEVTLARRRIIAAAAHRLAGFDALIAPTVAVLPPRIDEFDDGDPDHYSTRNLMTLRNTSIANFLDTCSISIPANEPGAPPVGAMLIGRPGADEELLALARAVEAAMPAAARP